MVDRLSSEEKNIKITQSSKSEFKIDFIPRKMPKRGVIPKLDLLNFLYERGAETERLVKKQMRPLHCDKYNLNE